jgi:hypothetical protein
MKRCLPEIKMQLKKYDTNSLGAVPASSLLKVMQRNGIRSVTKAHLERFAVGEQEGNDFQVDYVKFIWNYL